jgi:hypothetical protein
MFLPVDLRVAKADQSIAFRSHRAEMIRALPTGVVAIGNVTLASGGVFFASPLNTKG